MVENLNKFKTWNDIPPDLKTKTQWGKDGRNLKDRAVPSGYINGRRGEKFMLYSESETIPKKSRKKAESLELTDENIAYCLFVINKAAKRRRDSASDFYVNGSRGLASKRSAEKEELYDLKNSVLLKLESEKRITFEGFHQTKTPKSVVKETKYVFHDPDECFCHHCKEYLDGIRDKPGHDRKLIKEKKTVPVYMSLFSLAGYRFHMILESKPSGPEIKDLGEWKSEAISQDKLKVSLKDSIETLRNYLSTLNDKGGDTGKLI